MGVGDGGGGGIQTEIGKSKIIEGVAVSYQDASLPPHFQVLPTAQVELGKLSIARPLVGAASQFSQTVSGFGIQLVGQAASGGSLLLMVAGGLNVQTDPEGTSE